jgi:hypothetical protein
VFDQSTQQPQIREATTWEKFRLLLPRKYREQHAIFSATNNGIEQLYKKIVQVTQKKLADKDIKSLLEINRCVSSLAFRIKKSGKDLKLTKLIDHVTTLVLNVKKERQETQIASPIKDIEYFIDVAKRSLWQSLDDSYGDRNNMLSMINKAISLLQVWPQESERLALEITLRISTLMKKDQIAVPKWYVWKKRQATQSQDLAIIYIKKLLENKNIDVFLNTCEKISHHGQYYGRAFFLISLTPITKEKDFQAFIERVLTKVQSIDQYRRLVKLFPMGNTDLDPTSWNPSQADNVM